MFWSTKEHFAVHQKVKTYTRQPHHMYEQELLTFLVCQQYLSNSGWTRLA